MLPLRNTFSPTAASARPVIVTPLPLPIATTSAPSPAEPLAYCTNEKSLPGKLSETVLPSCWSPWLLANQIDPTGPQCPAVRMKSSCPFVTLKPAEQRPPVDRMGCAPLIRVVNLPCVRCISTEAPSPFATFVIADQPAVETELSASTSTLLLR